MCFRVFLLIPMRLGHLFELLRVDFQHAKWHQNAMQAMSNELAEKEEENL